VKIRTDLALELRQMNRHVEGVRCRERECGKITVTEIIIETESAAQKIGRPRGRYVTVSFPPLTDHTHIPGEGWEHISEPLSSMLPPEGTILVAGLGNMSVTPDALGPRAVSMIPATRHIMAELERSMGKGGMRSCAAVAPGVLGQTGVEAAELIRGVCRTVKPSAVIVIDALAARGLEHLGCTVQLNDTGIHPGSGVGSRRPAISQKELGVPVIAMGVPTVVDAATLAYDLCGMESGAGGMIVTPGEIDLLIDRAARLLALAVNQALHPSIDPQELISM